MGGEGSGRHADPIKRLLGTEQPAPTDNAIVYLPNYSGIMPSVRKDNPAGWTAGSVVFVGSDGNFAQNNSKLFWSNVSNRLGIGTTSPSSQLTIVTPFDGNTAAEFKSSSGMFRIVPYNTSIEVGAEIWARNAADTGTIHLKLDGTSIIFAQNGSEVARFSSDGWLGIGVPSPATKLDVAGNIKISTVASYIDLSSLDLKDDLVLCNATTNTPSTTWTAGVPSANPEGFIQININGSGTRYIPYWP